MLAMWFGLMILYGFLGTMMIKHLPLSFTRHIGFWLIFLAIIFLSIGIYMHKKFIEREIAEEKRINDIHEIPIRCPVFLYLSGHPHVMLSNAGINAWINENSFNVAFRYNETIHKHSIPLVNIKFYTLKGNANEKVKKGGNMTTGETMMAEALFGTAAAVAGNLKTKDARKTIINVDIDGENKFIFFGGADLYNYLLENLPEKEQSFVAMNK